MNSTAVRIAVGDVELVADLYPRLKPDDDTIERYRDALDQLPPIVVARGRVLVDGYHRWQAHKREGVADVPAEDLGNLTDAEIFNESIRRNSTHGQQLSRRDKTALARRLWQTNVHMGADRTAYIAELLAVSTDSVQRWTKDERDAEKADRDERIWAMWLDCHTQDEIAKAVGVDRTVVTKKVQEPQLRFSHEAPESRQHFDVWQFATADKDDGQQSYFGAIPPQVVENLLWFFTDVGSIVVDPFCGSGTTIDVAKRMGRRVFGSDRRGNEYSPLLPIHQHDITSGWPDAAPNKADLILLDPPYWKQAAGRYSDDDADLGNQTLDEFRSSWAAVVKTCSGHLTKGGRLAYIISPTQNDDGTVIDHATEMLKPCWDAGLTVERRIIVTYSTQQATGQQVTWARDNQRMLKLYRDLVVLR